MKCTYTKEQRAMAKKMCQGLFTVEVIDANGDGTTMGGPASAEVQDAVHELLRKLLGKASVKA